MQIFFYFEDFRGEGIRKKILLDFKEGGKERKQTWSRSRDREKGSAVIPLELTMGKDRKPSLVYQ